MRYFDDNFQLFVVTDREFLLAVVCDLRMSDVF